MTDRPLPERLRPRTLDAIAGHARLLGRDGELRQMVETGRLQSLVLWGPPGCGKTTVARALAQATGARWIPLSAVLDGVAALRDAVDSARGLTAAGHPPVLFVDEIHRWNKAQQDALLPHVEDGTVVLLGATTENPSVSLRPALRSRLRMLALDALSVDDVVAVLAGAWSSPDGLARPGPAPSDALRAVAVAAGGDVRRALLDLERVVARAPAGAVVDRDAVLRVLDSPDLRHDRDGDSHHDLVSAWIKSMRGSDPDAALYWLARLIAGGEDLTFLCRRLVVFASEDVGNADPRALQVAVAATQAVQLVGLPEARIPLSQATTWLACAPKSNAAYVAIDRALEHVKQTGALPVPRPLRQGVGAAGREAGLGVGYLYPHDFPDRLVAQPLRPDGADGVRYYEPVDHGDERTILQRLAWWARRLRERAASEER